MERMIERILLRWGTELTLLRSAGAVQLRGLLQHSRSKSLQNLRNAYSPLGQITGGLYVYIGPARPEAAAGDTLICGDKAYLLRRVEPVRFRSRVVYCWGLCVEKGGEPG